jgi:hypothetical protein
MRTIALLTLAIVSCAGTGWSGPPAQVSRKTAETRPLSRKQLIKIVLDSRDVLRGVDSSCANAGSEVNDRTLGDYIASILAQYAEPTGRNWITAACEPATAGDRKAKWECEVVFHREYGEDVFDWGLAFQLDGALKVLPASFRCTGAG